MANTNSVPPMSFKTTPADRRLIQQDARAAGLSVSSYIRSKLLDAPQTAATYKRTLTRRLMMRLIGDIGRVGNNMNQIAWKLNSAVVLTPLDRQLHAEGITALREMRGLLVNHLLHPGPC